MESQSDKQPPRADQPQPPSYTATENTTTTTTTSTLPGQQPSDTRQPAGSGYGERVRGAIDLVHGAGESLRGNIIGAVDTLFGGKHEAEATQITERGREEMRTGRMRMRSKDTRGEELRPAQVATPQEASALPQEARAPPQEPGAPALKEREPMPQQQPEGRTEQPGTTGIPVTSWS
ncbi:hypothetical protein APHAL10511_000311 [Amanita phalloides]|nr:hypothetical protein APHAL10511_000311 [Amanita phalloides]